MSATRADFSRTWAVVPIRGLATAKTRLGADLDAEERESLVTAMLHRTLVATRDAEAIRGAVVVTMDPAAAAIAQRHRAIGLVERVPGGLNAAIVAARSVAVARGASAVMVVPADLPAISARALDEIIGTVKRAVARPDARAGVVAVVPDRHDEGTNVLLTSPPDAIEPAFGAGSRAAHQAAAVSAGAAYLELGGPMRLDVDTAADLMVAEAALGGRVDG
jgi:2-phospho-L-lactate guanylyltransferase